MNCGHGKGTVLFSAYVITLKGTLYDKDNSLYLSLFIAANNHTKREAQSIKEGNCYPN